MPFVLIIVGVVFLVSGVRGTSSELLSLLRSDFTGPNNFLYWLLSILVIGAIGYIEPLKPVSRAFLALLIVVLFLTAGNTKNGGGGFFAQFNSQLFTPNPSTPSTTQGGASSPAPIM